MEPFTLQEGLLEPLEAVERDLANGLPTCKFEKSPERAAAIEPPPEPSLGLFESVVGFPALLPVAGPELGLN